jgi:NAD(P)-dependent dehydrogenase (short-subunit alcohol dehydrogenase family)
MKKVNFKDKVVVVTGGASGIGRAICARFAQEGAKIGILDRDETGIRASEQALRKGGFDVVAIRCDVTREDECKSAINEFVNRFDGIDVLVNNAGITLRDSFLNTQSSAYRKVIDVNFFGSVHCTKAAISSLIQRKGMIIVISSIAGFGPLLGRTGYCASKYALHGLFETLRLELKGHGVHVMMVCPSFVETNLQKHALGGNGNITTHPQSTMGKVASPEGVAEAVFRGAGKKKDLVVPTSMGKLAYWINRLMPKLYGYIVAREFRSELARKK